MGGVWKCWLRGGGKGRKGNARDEGVGARGGGVGTVSYREGGEVFGEW